MAIKNEPAPNHVAIIPDGNRRWAKKRGLKPWEGHFKGIGQLAEDIVWTAFDVGVRYLTVWGGSYDNLTKRSKTEIKMLNEAYRRFIRKALADEKIFERGVRVRFIGEWQEVLETKTIELIREVEAKTRKHNNFHLTVLAAYNGDREMLAGINKLISSGRRATPTSLKNALWTSALPPVDFIIRTSGEHRLSTGFLMWDLPYAELYFSEKLWPDFGPKDLLTALHSYTQRERRFGK